MPTVKRRKRTDRDRDFFVYLKDKHSNMRIAVGNFWAMSPDEAIDVAMKTYPGFFTKLETRSLVAHADETFALHPETP